MITAHHGHPPLPTTTSSNLQRLPTSTVSTMSARTTRNTSALHKLNNTQPLVMAEHWWRDRYNAIAEQGYRLRPQYHPQWGSSWSKIGKDFHTADHGQTYATIVRIVASHSFSSH